MLVDNGAPGEMPHGAEAWQVQDIRVTFFHHGGHMVADLQDWWLVAFGQEPNVVERRPSENMVLVRGVAGHGNWTAVAAMGRTDFVLAPGQGPSAAIGDARPLSRGATYRETVSEMADMVGRWLVQDRPIYRLAVGSRLAAPGPDLSFVYAALGVLLPCVSFDGMLSPDFLYRVNRERNLTGKFPFVVNRLATWAVAQELSVSVSPSVGEVDVAPVRYAAHLDLDVNTMTDETCSFSRDCALDVFQILTALSIEIAERGDVP